MKKITETSEQEGVIEYCDWCGYPAVHIANEGKRSQAYGAMLKRMGMRKGFPDIFIFRAKGKYHGLALEMKIKNNKPSEDQKQWLLRLKQEGYACAVCYSADEAIKTIESYMRG